MALWISRSLEGTTLPGAFNQEPEILTSVEVEVGGNVAVCELGMLAEGG